jgi:DUF2075 family protein
MIALEYGCPYNQSRIDCLLFGKEINGKENVVLLELKQWVQVYPMKDEGNFQEIYEVGTFTGGGARIVPHPSQQIKGYHNYLKSFITEFETPPTLSLFSYAYCHNYSKTNDNGLFADIYHKIIDEYPVYTRDETVQLAEKLSELLKGGQGFEIFNRFMRSHIKPSMKLLNNVTKIIKNESVFHLLNEQLVAKNLIWSKVRKERKQKEKSIIIVHGGPGTGKSLIAINILAEAARRKYKVFYGCKAKSFISGLQNLVGKDGKLLFSNLYRFLPSRMQENELDLLLVDESHRIEKNSNFQYTKPADKTELPQIDQLIRCAKTIVFFIDDKQNVRSQEIGSSELIRNTAKKFDITVWETTLETQYRCMGSNDYLLWLESVLGYSDSHSMLRKNEIFKFKVFSSPSEIYDQLKIHEAEQANSSRLVAGFCWPWSDPDNNGELVNDVVIGKFAMPWEAKEGFKLAKDIPKWYEWAFKPGGFKQIGCIYTAQGFEFDYIGVIIGDDLQYDPVSKKLTGNINATSDPTLKKYPDNFESYIRNIYRVLLTRGMKGCYVYFTNKETEAYFRSKIEQ